jgi:uncharacterized protein (TIGR02996 family)
VTVDPRAAVFEAILRDPGCDAARLAYADLLDEFGDAADATRAEFIRVQVGLEPWRGFLSPGLNPGSCCGLPGGRTKGGGKILGLSLRERELLEAHRISWAGPLPDLFGRTVWWEATEDLPWEFRRGFVSSLTLPSAAWLRHADDLLAAAPVTEVGLTTWLAPGWSGPTRRMLVAAGGFKRLIRSAYQPDGNAGREAVLAALAAEWPRLAFHLPA